MLLLWDRVLYFCRYIVKYLFLTNILAAGCWFILVRILNPHTPGLKHILHPQSTSFSPHKNPRWGVVLTPRALCTTPFPPSCVEKSSVLKKIVFYSRRNQYICIFFSIRRGHCSMWKDSVRLHTLAWLALAPQALNVIVTNRKSPCAQLLVAGDTGRLKESVESHSCHLKRTLVGQVRKREIAYVPPFENSLLPHA